MTWNNECHSASSVALWPADICDRMGEKVPYVGFQVKSVLVFITVIGIDVKKIHAHIRKNSGEIKFWT